METARMAEVIPAINSAVAAAGAPAALKGRPFLFAGGGLGDVARRFYMTNTYEILESLDSPVSILCLSHNPSATEFFRFHRNSRNLIIVDVGHIYTTLVFDPKFDNRLINPTLIALCGFRDAEQLTKPRDPTPIGRFYAPDAIKGSSGHVVVHPFGRGWGDWPDETVSLLIQALRSVPAGVPIFVLCADYISSEGRIKSESFPLGIPNIRVLRNLSVPAAFSLVASASRFIGTCSSLAQVAAFENVPSLVLHPHRCSDFVHPYSNYGKTILQQNGAGIAYDRVSAEELKTALIAFLEKAPAPMVVREALRGQISISKV
jgi:hypothetical protein